MIRPYLATGHHTRLSITRISFTLLVVAVGIIFAFTGSQLLYASSISQGFTTNENIPVGSIVSLEENATDTVVAATMDNADNLLGVVVNEGSFPLTLTNRGDNQVQIALSGRAPVLVSDLNGAIERGDHITASPISGIGMKATTNTKIIGIAQGPAQEDIEATETYTDENGTEQTVTLGQAPVQVSVSSYFREPEKTVIPVALQNVANSVAGKEVNTLPILISAGIFIITLVAVVSIIYSMIRSSIISVGRNPMSQSAIYRDVIQLSVLVLGILAVAMVAIYLILTRF